jgi:hypothetical protein
LVRRVVETPAMQAYFQRMADPATQELYRKRSQICEYPNMKIKAVWGLNRFRLRGLAKVTKEAFWMVMAFTMDHWLMLRRKTRTVAA